MCVICKVLCFLQKQSNAFLTILIVPNNLQHGLDPYSAHDQGSGWTTMERNYSDQCAMSSSNLILDI